MTLWIVGKLDPDVDGPWEVMGVYDSESKAVAACKDWRYFVGPEELNVPAPDARTLWPGAYYPHQKIDVERMRMVEHADGTFESVPHVAREIV